MEIYWTVKRDESNPLWENFKTYWRGLYGDNLKPSQKLAIEEELQERNYFTHVQGVWGSHHDFPLGYTEISLENWAEAYLQTI